MHGWIQKMNKYTDTQFSMKPVWLWIALATFFATVAVAR
jgi:hypothetical protein